LTMATVVCALIVTAILASWLPVHRATRTDPAITLRYE